MRCRCTSPVRFARIDYFLGKLGVIAALVAAVAVLPAVAAYVLGVCFSLDLTVIRDTWRLLPASILYGLVIVVSAGTLMLALSSLSRRSLYVGIAWVGLWIISSAVAAVLSGIQRRPSPSHVAGRMAQGISRPSPERRVSAGAQPTEPYRSSAMAAGARARGESGGRGRADRLAAVLLVHRQSAAVGRRAVEYRRRLGGDRPSRRSAAGPHRDRSWGVAARRRMRHRSTIAAWPTDSCRSTRGPGRPASWPACWEFPYGF